MLVGWWLLLVVLVILVFFGDFWVFFLMIFDGFQHLFSNLALILVMPHRKVSWHEQFPEKSIFITPVGNSGSNPHNPYGHLVVKNGKFRKKQPFFDTNTDQTKKTFFWQNMPPGISGNTKLAKHFFKSSVFLKKILKKGRRSIQFYSYAKELCSLEY